MPNIEASSEKKSLKARIRAAESKQEIESLLREGAEYPYASRRTRCGWQNAASQKRRELEA